MPDCDENMSLRYVMPKKIKALAQPVASSV